MNIEKYFLFCLILIGQIASAQSNQATISGNVATADGSVPYATVFVANGTEGTLTDAKGNYELQVSPGELTIQVSSQGYRKASKTVKVMPGVSITLNFTLLEDALGLDEVVISATRNRVERRNAPVVVSTLKPKLLTATQSTSLADGLKFAPGVRVETNCQNCGFTQVRLNGLEGGYTQILLNSIELSSAGVEICPMVGPNAAQMVLYVA